MCYLLWSLVVLAVIWGWNRINKKLFGDWFSPFNQLLFSWIGPLCLRAYSLSSLEEPWTTDLIFIIGWVTLSLVVTSLLARPFVKRSSFGVRKPTFDKTVELFQKKWFLVLVTFCFVASFVGYIYNEFITNPVGIPLITLAQNPSIPREPFHRWGKGSKLVILSVPLFLLSPMLYLAFRASRRGTGKVFLLLLAGLYPIGCLFKLSRIDLVGVSLNIVVVEYYYRMFSSVKTVKVRPKIIKYARYVLLLAMTIGLLIVSTNEFNRIRAGYDPSDRLQGKLGGITSDIPDPLYNLVVNLYAYFAFPFENFANFYQSYSGGYNPGIGFFRPILTMMNQGDVADAMLARINLCLRSEGFSNTYPFITLVYAELGLLGILLVPIIYGVFVNTLYVRFRRCPSFINFFWYLGCSYGWLWLFSAAGFTTPTVYLLIAFVFGLYYCYQVLATIGSRRLGGYS